MTGHRTDRISAEGVRSEPEHTMKNSTCLCNWSFARTEIQLHRDITADVFLGLFAQDRYGRTQGWVPLPSIQWLSAVRDLPRKRRGALAALVLFGLDPK